MTQERPRPKPLPVGKPVGTKAAIVASRDLQAFVERELRKRQSPVAIAEHPPVISSQERVGDVEANFIVGGKNGSGYLLTVVD